MNNKKVVYDQRGRYISLPSDYLNALMMNAQRDKASAFTEYFIDMHQEEVNSLRFYAKRWTVGKTMVAKWMEEFKEEIAKHHAYWALKNTSHYNSVTFKSGQEVDNEKNKSGQDKVNKEPNLSNNNTNDVDNEKNKSGQEVDKDLNTSNSNNINADSNESANTKSSSNRNAYSANFEILWNRYDKKTSNKGRSETIYKKKWKNTDIKILIEAIDEYKNKTDATYLKDFDGFLNGVINTYIPRRAWVIDTNKNKHFGWFYDSRNKFVSDVQKTLKIESQKIAEYIEAKKFGYVA
jgi:hypothetical protein